MKDFLDKKYLISVIITVLISIIIVNFPLSSGVTYEFSFITNVFLIILYPFIFKYFRINLYKSYTLLFIPPIVNLLSFKNICDPLKGILFYFLIPVTTLFLIYELLLFLDKNKLKKYFFIIFLSLLADLYLLYSEPQIFFYNSFWGYFQGSLYDVDFSVSKPLYILALFKIINAFILFYLNKFGNRKKKILKTDKVILIVLIVSSSGIFFLRGKFNMTGRHVDIRNALGGYYSTEHFNIYYSDTETIRKNIKRLALEHEMRLAQLEKMYDVKYAKKIDSYVFEDSKQKKELMGAGNTLIAKPWLGEIYINYDFEFPNPYLKHELSHVIAARFNNGFLHIPMKFFIIPQMGIVEGFAVSSEDQKGDLTIFEKMAILKKNKRFPPIEKMVSFDDFWSYNGYFAYQSVGGFLKFLRIKYGVEKLKQLYSEEDFKFVYKKSILDLKKEYLKFLSNIKFPQKYISKVKKDFNAKSVFKRVCPHDIAQIKRDTETNIKKYGFEKGIKTAYELLKLEPWNENHKIFIIKKAVAHKKYDFALNYLNDLKKNGTYVDKLRADVYWLNGFEKRSKKNYEKIINENIPDYLYREIYIKIKALEDNDIKNFVRDYLLKRERLKSYLYNFHDVQLKEISYDIINYLYGRNKYNYGDYDEAVFYLGRVGNLLPYEFKTEILKLKIKSYFYLKKWKQAEVCSEKLIDLSKNNGLRNYAENWKFYIDYFSKNFK